jgi:hypothetical protein
MAAGKTSEKDHFRSEKDHQRGDIIRPRRIHLFIVLFILHSLFLIVHGQELHKVQNNAFIRGESFEFNAYYDSFVTGKVTAGAAKLEVKFEDRKIEGRSTYHLVGEGKSKGAFNLFFKVNDRFESYIDEEYLVPWQFTRKTREGDYKKEDEVRFNQFSGSASSSKANKKVPSGIQDVLSVFYFARTFDLSDARIGQNFPLTFFLDDSVYVSQIQFAGRENIMTDLGTFRCLKFKPMVITGNVFSQPYPMDIWISDDENHMPVLAKSAVIVGSVKLELVKYKGLANPVTSLIKSK